MNDDIKDFGLEFVLTDIALKAVNEALEKPEPEKQTVESGS